jgi:hypothetical protein
VSVSPLSERAGLTVRKFDAGGGGGAATSCAEPGSTTSEPSHPAAGEAPVGEAAVDRRRRLGVIGLHQVAEGAACAPLAQPRPELGEQAGVANLLAAPVAEERADEGVGGDHVVDRPRRLVVAGGAPGGVDPIGVGGEVAQHLPALDPVPADEQRLLAGHQPLGGGAGGE